MQNRTVQKQERVIAAIVPLGGNKSLIAQQAGITRDTLYRWLNCDVGFKERYEAEESRLIQHFESKLMVKAIQGDTNAMLAVLRRVGSVNDIKVIDDLAERNKRLREKHGKRY